MADIERLLRDVEFDPNGGCWLWSACVSPRGYGRVKDGGENRLAHRTMWKCVNGPIPDGVGVLHKCDVPACVNPAHLFLGTPAVNMADKCAKGRGWNASRPGKVLVKLDEEKVRDIRSRRLPIKGFARLYGADKQTIKSAMRGDTWRHVPMSDQTILPQTEKGS